MCGSRIFVSIFGLVALCSSGDLRAQNSGTPRRGRGTRFRNARAFDKALLLTAKNVRQELSPKGKRKRPPAAGFGNDKKAKA